MLYSIASSLYDKNELVWHSPLSIYELKRTLSECLRLKA